MPKPSPVTGKSMTTRRFGPILVEVCESGGIWFDAGELQRLLTENPGEALVLEAAVKPTRSDIESFEPLPCPVDSTKLEIYRFQYTSKIELHQCRTCGGIWVEDGELTMIYKYLSEQEIAGRDIDPDKLQPPVEKAVPADFNSMLERRTGIAIARMTQQLPPTP